MLAALVLLQGSTVTSRAMSIEVPPDSFKPGEERVLELGPIYAGFLWTEVVPSWNVHGSERAEMTLEAKVVRRDGETKWYSFGTWSLSPSESRGSVKDQKDEDGNVLTDTLRVVEPGGRVMLRLTTKTPEGESPVMKRLVLSFVNTNAVEVEPELDTRFWDKVLEPPQRAQGNYPNGKVLCSPTCVAMSLGYWAGLLQDQSIDTDVPELEKLTWDPVYNGAGNWSYNVAAAGAKPGMVAYTHRLSHLNDLERWINAGVPVVCSVSWYYLHGQELKDDENGHLVVLVGFDKDGNPVFNDPGDRKQVRKTYKREDFKRAWDYSKRTVYLIYPEGHPIPLPIGNEWLRK
jgi:hypothetical protein